MVLEPSPMTILTDTTEQTRDLAWTKRLLERLSEPGFAERLHQDPDAAGAALGMPWSPTRIRPLWDRHFQVAAEDVDPLVRGWQRVIQSRLAIRAQLREEGAIEDPALRAWRERQMRRCTGELGITRAEAIIHAPFTVELSKGCSVGCWFCGLSAGRLEDHLPYTPENAENWRGMLAVLREEIGRGAKWGFCYWATDPLDNPDYERFLDDFQARMGVIPQTTTALAMKDPERTRRVLAQARAGTPVVSRFSVLTPGLLRKIHDTFTPEELLEVELIVQGAGGPVTKAVAGRARTEQVERSRKEGLNVDQEELSGTIACVSGFLVQPMLGRVQLISPCRSVDRWPEGYIVFGERSFTDPESFRRAICDLRDTFMTVSVRDLPRLRPGRVWKIVPSEDGLYAESGLVRVHLRAPQRLPAVHALADLLQAGQHDAATLAMLLFYTSGQAEDYTLADLEQLFQHGILDEEPAP